VEIVEAPLNFSRFAQKMNEAADTSHSVRENPAVVAESHMPLVAPFRCTEHSFTLPVLFAPLLSTGEGTKPAGIHALSGLGGLFASRDPSDCRCRKHAKASSARHNLRG